jgi:hypothetical protein
MIETIAQSLPSEKVADFGSSGCGKKGAMQLDGEVYLVSPFEETAAETEQVFDLLQQINEQEQPPEVVLEAPTPEEIEIESEIDMILHKLGKADKPETAPDAPPTQQPAGIAKPAATKREDLHPSSERNGQPNASPSPSGHSSSGGSKVVYSSLFSLVKSFLTEGREKNPLKAQQESTHAREESRSHPSPLFSMNNINVKATQDGHYEREGDGKQEHKEREDKEGKDGFGGGQQNRDQREQEKGRQDKKRKVVPISGIQAAREGGQSKKSKGGYRAQSMSDMPSQGGTSHGGRGDGPLASMENIFMRFMALMARILGQAEADAHELYLRIKERTDNIDILTLLASKLTMEKGSVDWTNNEEMKKLIDKARELGVPIPQKYKWSEDERKVLVSNIQSRKESMEKVTQLERTDMQRYLQEASQCHQARSNVLKLMKEVGDNIIGNMRP